GEMYMTNVILVFASMTGNTEEIAQLVGKGVKEAGVNLTIRELPAGEPKELEQYDGILLGSYTYGDGELADEFLDFYDDMDGLNLDGKFAAVFGSGDTAYEQFCVAVDILTEKLQELGATIVQEGLKIELSPEDEKLCINFGKSFAKKVKEVKAII
ncbi:MAG: flavodoxin, partial [Bacillus sp. (in: firmicutes)]